MLAGRSHIVAVVIMATLSLATLRSSTAFAQAGVPPDIVRLKDGGMVRGTIVELVPGKEVTLVDVAGQTRKIPMDGVAYAGPAAHESAPSQPATPPAAAPVSPPAATPPPPLPAPTALHLLAEEPNWTYYVQAGTSQGVGAAYNSTTHTVMPVGVTVAHNRRLCTAPCATTLEPGSYNFGVERPDRGVLYAPAITVRGDETLQARLVSRSAARWGTFLGGVAVLGLGFLIASSGKGQECHDEITGIDQWGQFMTAPSCTTTYPNAAVGGIVAGLGASLAIFGPLLIGDGMRVAPVAP